MARGGVSARLRSGRMTPFCTPLVHVGRNYVRVYTGDSNHEGLEHYYVKKILTVLHTCEGIQERPWVLFPAHDDPPKDQRSGFLVLTRLWQVCKNQGLRYFINATAVQTVTQAVQHAVINRKSPLCNSFVAKQSKKRSSALGTPNTVNKNLVSGNKNSASNRKKRQNK